MTECRTVVFRLMAEEEGFEPPVPFKGTTVFKTARFNRSRTPPVTVLQACCTLKRGPPAIKNKAKNDELASFLALYVIKSSCMPGFLLKFGRAGAMAEWLKAQVC